MTTADVCGPGPVVDVVSAAVVVELVSAAVVVELVSAAVVVELVSAAVVVELVSAAVVVRAGALEPPPEQPASTTSVTTAVTARLTVRTSLSFLACSASAPDSNSEVVQSSPARELLGPDREAPLSRPRIDQALDAPFDLPGAGSCGVGLSIGAVLATGGERVEALIAQADRAMDDAKRQRAGPVALDATN